MIDRGWRDHAWTVSVANDGTVCGLSSSLTGKFTANSIRTAVTDRIDGYEVRGEVQDILPQSVTVKTAEMNAGAASLMVYEVLRAIVGY